MFLKKTPNYWVYAFLIIFSIIPIMKIPITLIITIIYILLLIFIFTKTNIKKFPLLLFIISLIIRVLVCLFVDTIPFSDFAVLLNASRNINIGDYSFNNEPYFYNWAYQIGFVFYQSLLLKIINDIMFLKIANCFITSTICILVYLIAKEFMKEKYARIVSIFYATMIFPATYVTVLTNQHLSALLIYLGLFFLITKSLDISESKKYLIAGVLLSFGNIIRPEGIITILSIILYLLMVLNKKNIKQTIKNILILITSYYAIFFICSKIFIISGIGPYGLSNNAPYWKFVLGFNHETNGSYSDNDTYVIGNKEAGYKLIKERINVKPTKMLKLFAHKSNTFWNQSTLYWSFNNLYDNKITIFNKEIKVINIVVKLNELNDNFLHIMYILLVIGVYKYIKQKKWNTKILILINQVFVTLGVYLLIEVQARYAYFIQITTVILMGLGIEYLCNIFNKYKKYYVEINKKS